MARQILDQELCSDDLEAKFAELGYQITKVARRVKCWVLLKNGHPVAHVSAGDDYEAIRKLAKRYGIGH